ncbi:MAG: PKD repeat protein, partial [Chlorobi bacterium OLB7]
MNRFFNLFLRGSIAGLLGVCLLWQPSNAQSIAPTIEWQRSFGGTKDDAATSISQTSDGGYIIAGVSSSIDGDVSDHHGGYDYWIVKLTSGGELAWQKSLGGKMTDYAASISQTSDGGYIVAGWSASTDGNVTGNHGDDDYWIVKLTSAGVIEWEKSLGGSGRETATSITQTGDGGYIVAGSSTSTNGDVSGNHGGNDYWIVKLTSTGGIEWQKSLGGSGVDDAYSITQTRDGGYIVVGWSQSTDGDVTGHAGYSDAWIVKLTGAGGSSGNSHLVGATMIMAMPFEQTSDGGYIVAGASRSND